MVADKQTTTYILLLAAMEAERQGLPVHSDDLLERASKVKEGSLQSCRVADAAMLLEFADVCAERGRLEKAESLCREALNLLSQLKGTQHISTALAMRNLVDLCRKRGKDKEAADLNCQVSTIFAMHRGYGTPFGSQPSVL